MKALNETVVNEEIKTWIRAKNIHISNPLGGKNVVTFHQELVRQSPTRTDVFREGSVSLTIEDFSTVFALINPLDGSSLGSTATYQDILVMMYSVYVAVKQAE